MIIEDIQKVFVKTLDQYISFFINITTNQLINIKQRHSMFRKVQDNS